MIDRVRDWAGWRAKVQLRPDACRVVGARTRAAGGLKRERHGGTGTGRCGLSMRGQMLSSRGRGPGAPSPSWNVPAPEGHQRRLVCLRSGAQSEERGTLCKQAHHRCAHIPGPRASSTYVPSQQHPASSERAFNIFTIECALQGSGSGRGQAIGLRWGPRAARTAGARETPPPSSWAVYARAGRRMTHGPIVQAHRGSRYVPLHHHAHGPPRAVSRQRV